MTQQASLPTGRQVYPDLRIDDSIFYIIIYYILKDALKKKRDPAKLNP
jgi:hypothetical protein